MNHILHNGIYHDEMVQALKKSGEQILPTLTPRRVRIWDNASCIMGEAGELFDAIKKHVFYGTELDLANVTEELGDLEFYLEDLRRTLGLARETTLRANIEKLAIRYKDMKYSDAAAQERADKSDKITITDWSGKVDLPLERDFHATD